MDSRVTGLTYSANGTRLGNLIYTYDADGRRTALGGSPAAVNFPANEAGGTSTAYNADNEPTKFNGVAQSGACPVRKRRDGMNPAQELDGAAPPNVTANLLTGLDIDEYFTRADTSGAMNFLADALGSTIALTDSGGSINTSYTYEPFGNTTISGPNANPYQFTGRENDGTGLYYYRYRARYYSPTFQRFIAQDPLDFRGNDTNLYRYVLDSPIDFVDPFGIDCIAANGKIWGTFLGNVAVGLTSIGAFIFAPEVFFDYYPTLLSSQTYFYAGVLGGAIGQDVDRFLTCQPPDQPPPPPPPGEPPSSPPPAAPSPTRCH